MGKGVKKTPGPKLTAYPEAKPNVNYDSPKGYGGAPMYATGHRLRPPSGDDVYPNAYGGAPTMYKRARLKGGKGNAGGGGSVNDAPSFSN